MRSLYIFALLIQTVLANWKGCITADEELSGKVSVVKDKDTAVCLTVAIDAEDWANPTDYKRFSFAPQADDYSRFVVEGCKSSLFEPLSRNTAPIMVVSYTSLLVYSHHIPYTQPPFLFIAILSF